MFRPLLRYLYISSSSSISASPANRVLPLLFPLLLPMLMPFLMGDIKNPRMIPQENNVVHSKNAVDFLMMLTAFHLIARYRYTTIVPGLQPAGRPAGK